MYWRYAIRSLGRGGQHTLFAIICVAVGVMVIVALQLVGLMVNAALTGNIRAFNGGDLAVHSETGIGERQLSYFAQLQSEGTITAYSPAIIDEGATPFGGGLQRVSFWAVDPATFPLAGTMPVISPSGADTATLLRGQGSAVATDTLAQRLHLHIGDTLPLTISSGRAGSVTISGEIATLGVISDRADLLMSRQTYASFRNLTGAPAGYGWVFVNVSGHSDATAARVAAQIHQQFPDLATTTVPQAQQQAQSELDGIRTFLRIIGLLALLIGGVGIINTMQVLLRRRLLEIAMLKTQGYRQRHLLLMFGIEALLLGAIGGVVGALLGIGLSFLVQALVERAFFLTIPTIIEPLTVASGVAIGVATTLIFGLLPIVRTSAVRPLAVLREMGADGARASRMATVGLLLLLSALFFLLALGILGNLTVALAVVLGVGLALGLLTAFFSLVAGIISHWPTPSLRRGVSLLALVPFLLIGLLLLRLSTGFGVLLLALVVIGLLVAVLPRAAQAETQLGLRNIGRARVRSATTLVALFVGVFAIGLGLALGQNLKDFIASRNAAVNQDNAYILANSQDAPLVATQLGRLANVSNEQVSLAAPARLMAIDGQAVPTASGPSETANLTGVNGFDLAKGSLPPATLAQGTQDTHAGRLLNARDAGTRNAVFPLSESDAPDKLKLGDDIVMSSLDGKATQTLHVVGFYTGLGTFAGLSAILTDRGVAATLSNGNPYTIFAVRLPPATQSQDLQAIKQAVPGVITLGDAATLNDIDTILNNIVQVIEVIASLAMFAGLALIANTVALAMLERRRELGILKAIGHTSRGIMGMVLAEQAVLAMVGAYSALLVVSVAATVLTQMTFHTTTESSSSVPLTLALAAATVALCMLVAGGVAWRATHIRPIEALRYE
ncbi:MAG TPA: FtsX-like permease family protein [Ktedonobacterales bacterium]|jgi:predicted lysophospholipase L1 biosynthesis ABC-type transport system permease subunit